MSDHSPQITAPQLLHDLTGQSHKDLHKDWLNQVEKDHKEMPHQKFINKYRREYNSYKNCKSKCKNGKWKWPRHWNTFKQFLLDMGPSCEGETLDRIDNENLNYGQGLCRWADKITQNNNKSDNVRLIYKGESKTVAQWAKELNLPSATMYKRKKLGWPDHEVIEGREAPSSRNKTNMPWPKDNAEAWAERYVKYGFSRNLSPCAFVVTIATQRLGQLQDLYFTSPRDPDNEPLDTLIDEHIRDASYLWVERLALAKEVVEYEKLEMRWKNSEIRQNGWITKEEFFKGTSKPNLATISELTGDLPKDRPVGC
jgi:hypothetical protein